MGVYYTKPIRPDELYRHGIKGMRWGVRRFQNEDGTWKNAKARARHSKQQAKSEKTPTVTRKSDMGEKKTVNGTPKRTTTSSSYTNSYGRKVTETYETYDTSKSFTDSEKKKYGMNNHGWMSEDGKKLHESELEKIEKTYAQDFNKSKTDSERAAALNNYYRQRQEYSDKAINKHHIQQASVERSYKQATSMAKSINRNIKEGQHEVEVAFDKYGRVIIRSKDPQYMSARDKGFQTAKSLQDIMDNVNVSDIKRTKYVAIH